MSLRRRYASCVAPLLAVLSTGAGCAKDATEVLVVVDADAAVPPILILRASIGLRYDPTRVATSQRSSRTETDAADRPGPFVFPLSLPLTVDPSFAGPVDITVEGVDWDSSVVIASGTTSGAVIVEKTTAASLTLKPTAPADRGDGGSD
jgi:hypothetical protein